MSSVYSEYFQISSRGRPIVGDTKTSAVNIDHLGWLVCDGRSFPTSQFPFLFDVIGYSFGGSGSNFSLPNPKGCVPGFIGSNAGGPEGYTGPTGPTSRALGDIVGEEGHILTIGEMPTHNHGETGGGDYTRVNATSLQLVDPGHVHSGTTNAGGFGGATTALTGIGTDVADNSGSHTHTFTTNTSTGGTYLVDPTHQHQIYPSGGSNFHNNMQPTMFIGNLFMYSGNPFYGTNPLCALSNGNGQPTNII